jgi:two-component system sensor histidine kinase DesK
VGFVKERLNNIYKHSKAENVEFKFSLKNNEFVMKIKDDGVGFSPKNIRGNGLNNMKRRMENLLGDFEMIPSDKGVTLIFKIITDKI